MPKIIVSKALLHVSATLLALFWSSHSLHAAEQKKVTVPSPVSGIEAIKYLQVHPDLKVELVAAEPQVIDPVAVRFDELGQMWVVEMIDYPLGPKKEGEPPMSRIKVLKDKDGDGYYETVTVFADRLLFVTGLLPWKGGVIATLSGEVAYFKDTNGDGKSDIREQWFVGFAEANTQLRANHPTFGLDNSVYIASGLRGGEIRNVNPDWSDHAEAVPVSLRGKDFRFHPHTGEFSAVAGNGQFGLSIDSNGSRYLNSNRNPCMQVMLEDHYLKRNSQLIVSSVINDVSPAGGDSRVYALTSAWTTSNLHAGQFTAACGVHRYEGSMLPAEFYGNSFTCEPTGNLVHRDVLTASGATFKSHYGREKIEFMASHDDWFRPVNVQTGPDGALYVCDMYRAVIEHPQWVPKELQNRPDERYGDDKGRIYRMVPKKQNTVVQNVTFNVETPQNIAAQLDHPNSWHRKTAARLIYQTQLVSAEKDIRQILKSGKVAAGRVRALYALHGLNRLKPSDLEQAFKDQSPRVVEHAVKLSEPWFNDYPKLQAGIDSAAGSNDERLLFQVALSAGEIKDLDVRLSILKQVASLPTIDKWTTAAVISSAASLEGELLAELIQVKSETRSPLTVEQQQFMTELALIVGANKDETELQQTLVAFLNRFNRNQPGDQLTALKGLQAFIRGYSTRGARKHFMTLAEYLSEDEQQQYNSLGESVERIAKAEQGQTELSQVAIQVMIYTPAETSVPILLEVLETTDNQAVQQMVLQTLGAHSGTDMADSLLDLYVTSASKIRRAILTTLMRDVERTKVLLSAIEDKDISPAELDQNQKKQLLAHRNAEIKALAAKLLVSNVSKDRSKVIEKYKAALAMKADAKRGKLVFGRVCATCHKVGDIGVNVAPDISDSRTKQPIQYLTDILNPNFAVDNNYFSYTILTTEGKTHSGIIASETSTSVVLKQPENKEVSLLRSEIELIKADGVSLMPNGLEQNIKVDEMADLLSFLKNWRYIEGQIPIETNQPLK